MRNFGIAIMMSVVLAFSACSKMDSDDKLIVYEPTWAAVYDHPVGADGSDTIGLVLVQGRTDDDFSFTSSGAALSLVLHAGNAEILLPEGEYDSEDGGHLSKSCASVGKMVSFIAERLPDSDMTRVFPVDSWTLRVRRGEGEVFIMKAEVEADGRRYEFDYRGSVQDFRLEED